MNPRDKKIKIASFDDTTVIGINSGLPDYKLAWSINKQLSIDLVRYDDLEFEGTEFSFFYYTAGENYNVYNLVSLVRKDKVLYSFNPRLDYLFLIQNSLTAERRLNLIQSIRAAEGIVHAFLLEKDKVMRQVLETIGDCEQKMIDKKKKLNNLNEVRKQMREQEALQAQLRENS
ncbi:MAG: IPExxxVDY family protein [Bacteroidales bacterium]|nr:IPExxxVDY family protein [Bacteroidales bacterium]